MSVIYGVPSGKSLGQLAVVRPRIFNAFADPARQNEQKMSQRLGKFNGALGLLRRDMRVFVVSVTRLNSS